MDTSKDYEDHEEDDRIVNGYHDRHKPWSAELYDKWNKLLICGSAIINSRFVV